MNKCRICGMQLDILDDYEVDFNGELVYHLCLDHFKLAKRTFWSWLGNQDMHQHFRKMKKMKHPVEIMSDAIRKSN